MFNLKALRESLNKKQGDFAAEFGIPQTTYSGYELGQREPKVQFWIDVSDKYKVSTDYLLGQTDDPHGTKYPAKRSPLEEKYEKLDDHGKRVVDAVMELEADRFAETLLAPPPQEKPKTKTIPLFPAAAGPGEIQEDIAFSEHEVPIMSKAEFAVKVSGDSMEPELHDGDIVLCTKRTPMEGELAAIMVNGFLFVKQVERDKYGNLHLLSINRQRSFLDIHLLAGTTDTVTVYGTLIHRVMPPISYYGM